MDVMSDIDIICKQTCQDDKVLVERVYIENNRSIADTIMVLMNYSYCKEVVVKPRTVFDDIREIVAEKEQIFMDIMKSGRLPRTSGLAVVDH